MSSFTVIVCTIILRSFSTSSRLTIFKFMQKGRTIKKKSRSFLPILADSIKNEAMNRIESSLSWCHVLLCEGQGIIYGEYIIRKDLYS